jgi:hypothetical protein
VSPNAVEGVAGRVLDVVPVLAGLARGIVPPSLEIRLDVVELSKNGESKKCTGEVLSWSSLGSRRGVPKEKLRTENALSASALARAIPTLLRATIARATQEGRAT